MSSFFFKCHSKTRYRSVHIDESSVQGSHHSGKNRAPYSFLSLDKDKQKQVCDRVDKDLGLHKDMEIFYMLVVKDDLL